MNHQMLQTSQGSLIQAVLIRTIIINVTYSRWRKLQVIEYTGDGGDTNFTYETLVSLS